MALPLHLASRSPRRADLLCAAGIPFVPGPFPDVDESLPPGVDPAEAARRLAERKARAAVLLLPGPGVVLAADTIVYLGREVFGKPPDPRRRRPDAPAPLGADPPGGDRRGGGPGSDLRSAVDVAEVGFRVLSEAEILAYVETGEPLDKAGAYALQGGAAAFVRRRRGGGGHRRRPPGRRRAPPPRLPVAPGPRTHRAVDRPAPDFRAGRGAYRRTRPGADRAGRPPAPGTPPCVAPASSSCCSCWALSAPCSPPPGSALQPLKQDAEAARFLTRLLEARGDLAEGTRSGPSGSGAGRTAWPGTGSGSWSASPLPRRSSATRGPCGPPS